MAFTVLKISKAVESEVEVVGEFPNESEASTFADDAHQNDGDNDYDYIVEWPPSETKPDMLS